MVITSSTRNILSSAINALTGPLPVHKSKSVLRAEQHAALIAKRKIENVMITQDFDPITKETTILDIKYDGTPQDHAAQIGLYESIAPFAHGHEDSHKWEGENNKPKSQRTYYLGFGGCVSQRLALVGDLHATCRAHDTAEALDKFAQSYRAHGCQPLFAPFVKGH